ncbi:MAG: carboxylesterase [Rhodocyclaceae bacterium]|nr:carboxylesterase [Rhodocyclaceae bacterium]
MDTSTTPPAPPAPLPGIEIETGPSPERAVIWLHGLGADGNDFVPVVQALDMDRLPPTRFILPHAPSRPVTVNGGYVMPAWFDIYSLEFGNRREDAEGIAASAAQVEAFIARENARGIEDRHIVLAGFSQGGAIVLHAGLRHPRRLAGVLALSTFVPLAATLAAEANAANRDLPVFMAHGEEDPVIPHDFGRISGDILQAMGYPLRWRSYPMEHAVCMEEIRDLEDWLAEVLGDAGP